MPYLNRKLNRLAGYDYSTANYYYITICTAGQRCLFGTPGRLNALGRTQNSSHNPSLPKVVANYKAGVSRIIHKTCPELIVWQSHYYDEIIRNEEHYLAVWNYIDGNPSKWMEDKYYMK